MCAGSGDGEEREFEMKFGAEEGGRRSDGEKKEREAAQPGRVHTQPREIGRFPLERKGGGGRSVRYENDRILIKT